MHRVAKSLFRRNLPGAADRARPRPLCVSQESPFVASAEAARHANSFLGFPVYSHGERVGRVSDLVIDEKNWRILQVVVKVGPWPFRLKIHLSPRRFHSIDWSRARVEADVPMRSLDHIIYRHQPVITCPLL